MYRKQSPRQPSCFIPGDLSDYVPDDHILKQVDRVLDLSWLHEEVKDLYDEATGRPCIDPEQAVRLMLAGFLHGVVHDRKLMREAQVNMAYRWFAGYELDKALPDHSSLTRIRQRWGEERFGQIFERSVLQCSQAGLVGGDLVHVDASLVRADVSWGSLVRVHVSKVLEENEAAPEAPEDEPPADDEPPKQPAAPPAGEPPKQPTTGPPRGQADKPSKPAGKVKKVSKTDPDASMATGNRGQRLDPSYKQHTALDDRAGVIVDVHVTTGEANEGQQLLGQLNRVAQRTGQLPQMVTADSAYASAANYAALEQLGVEAVIPPQREGRPRSGLPLQRFAYDAHRDVVVCPSGTRLRRKGRAPNGWWYRARPADCQGCPLKQRCLSPRARSRSVCIKDGYCALLRARRRKQRGWTEPMVDAYRRHRCQAEGIYGEAKGEHGLRRAVRRGTSNMRIQAYLTAAVINLKRLALHAARLLRSLLCRTWDRRVSWGGWAALLAP
jgi:transposase